ncbi:hypothetical protein SERLA73DRAFT_97496 [Serpula lacrymans var. lacrymans S7.3]|uniref:Dienelactone hydrolase domain-containing protein n=2 Tax=Serpula lacrymans var. lacrymans TaxID=341189 RepID=F8QD99_SERL3|nr:uncharacterized protein SERLADRAFT_480010 [Serpula lacrymans var. lacrymans S7.9]EGN93570.1 hypothetical protein SERLA73DRAFT_97496 [Serpula lacrymans var. lacrymans S7.3]EGO18942.1 hypothetical protein SERLADRAFT_480010 [Serpula lacrymans var. lacrymans S7.9]
MSSTTLASAPASCCFTGVKHFGTPVGRVVDLGGLETYISEPKEQGPQKIVMLFLADVWGSLWINNKLLQDYFASVGYYVLGPDYLFGDAVPNHPPDFDRHTWAKTKLKPARDAFPKWLEAVKEIHGTENTKYCAVGYCFGAPFVMELAATDFIEAGALAHPAFLDESHFEDLKKPLLLCCAEEDHTFPLPSRRRAEDILVERKANYYFQIFAGIKHGFAVRGNPDVEQERWSKEECARTVDRWFKRFAGSE